MKKFLITAVVLGSALGLQAQQTNAPSRLDYPSFHIIPERNIFNMNRSARGAAVQRPPRIETERRPSRVESFALLGTMSYEKGRFAFFEGSGSQYSQVLSSSNSIGGFTITEVAPNYVKLASTNGVPIELPVGKQMKRFDEGEWNVTEREESSRSYARSSSSSERRWNGGRSSYSSSSPSSSSVASGPESEEALKRLMQKREQEAGRETTSSSEPTPAAPTEQTPEAVEKKPEPTSNSNSAEDAILRRLLEKREQETK
ncbi:MAG TPA: hypothetical protein VMZ27_16085 [Candidatus Saccharimonadales bacterium]|nr:hypothetical protein [Candidatus Saccharimonadales bacterium]